MGDDLERLAAKGRRATSQSRDRAAAQRERAGRKRADAVQRLIDRSLGAPRAWWVPVLLVAVVLGVAYLFVSGVPGLPSEGAAGAVTPILAAVAVGLGLYLFTRALQRRRVKAELAWMRSLPFAFDVDAYLDHLGEERMRTRAELEVEFAEEVVDRETIAAAARGAVDEATCRWKGDALVVTSGPIDTYARPRSSSGGTDGVHDNSRAHRWIRALVDGGLRTIHGRHPVKRVQIQLRD